MPLPKKYTIKVWKKDGTGLGVVNWDFSKIEKQINGSSTCDFQTDITYANFSNQDSIRLMNRVQVIASTTRTDPIGKVVFDGYIASRNFQFKGSGDSITVSCFGHASRLFESIYRNGTTVVMDFTGASADKASDISKDIINKYRTTDSLAIINYSTTSVEDSTDNIQYKFEMVNCGEALNKIVRLAYDASRIWFWKVDDSNIFWFKKASQTADHSFIFGKDITDITIEDDLINCKNELFLYYNSTIIKRYTDTVHTTISTAEYGRRSEFINESGIPDATSAGEYANAFLDIYNYPIIKIRVVISDLYDIEKIDVGDTCKILNIQSSVASILSDNMIIVKTSYDKNNDTKELELSIRHPLMEEEIEKLRRGLQQESFSGIPTTYTP